MSDIALLFAKDPLKHTREDIDSIIQTMRASRHQFKSGIKVGTKAAPAVTKAAALIKDLGDLGELSL